MRYSILLIIAVIYSLTFAEGFSIGVNSGVSNSNVSGTDNWNTGLAIGVHLFYAPSDNIIFGLRTAYNRWSPDADSFLNELPVDVTDSEIEGSGTVWEIVPSIRIATNIPGSQVGLFGHFGAGLFVISSDITAEGTSGGAPFSQEMIDSTENVWGITMGLGISIGRLYGFGIEFLPLYNVVDINNSPRQYYTISLGISYEF